MNLKCKRCGNPFDADPYRGYCDDCLMFFQSVRDRVHAAQRPAPDILADGKFAPEDDCPHSVWNPVSKRPVCGLCGSEELDAGYGLGSSGHGIGTYNFCLGCEHFLDFSEDRS